MITLRGGPANGRLFELAMAGRSLRIPVVSNTHALGDGSPVYTDAEYLLDADGIGTFVGYAVCSVCSRPMYVES